MSTVLHVVPGPERHGVTRHALELLARQPLADQGIHRLLSEGARSVEETRRVLAAIPPAPLTHLHLTDHLLGASAGECAELVVDLARSRPLSLTLHDLPQRADGAGRYERRASAYAAMAVASSGVVVASNHERDLLVEAVRVTGRSLPQIEVVPLPLDRQDAGAPPIAPEGPRRLTVFGYVYPGKGHAQAVEALAALPADVGLLALGSVSPGHERLVEELRTRAAELGRGVDTPGYVAQEETIVALRRAWVPVAPHLHVSASGSIGSWLAAGRRPVVPAGNYVDELESRCPGSLLRYGPGLPYRDLASAAQAALDDPALTWLGDVPIGPGIDEVAARLAHVLEDWARSAAPAGAHR